RYSELTIFGQWFNSPRLHHTNLRLIRGLFFVLSNWRPRINTSSDFALISAAHPFMDAAGKSLQPTNMLSLG
ncbi:MAG: hypothetical protein WA045_16010, partial [Nitrospira sp.]